MIAENLKSVKENIRAACERSGRSPEDVRLVAVSKTKPAEAVEEAAASGQLDFGENKAQEMVAKKQAAEAAGCDVRWHFIGNLQRNKVKYVVGNAVMIHSVSSLELAEEIERVAAKKNVVIPVLVEVNIADEATKHGLEADSAEALAFAIASKMPHMKLKGLMAIAPPVENGEENRVYFREMRALLEDLKRKLPAQDLTELSMGMSDDYETAVEEGATLVRVGTAIFGKRNIDGPSGQ